MRFRLVLAAVAAAAALAACGGGGGSGSTPPYSPPGGSPTTSPQSGTERLTIVIPAASTSAARRRPAYVSPSTRSVAIVVPGGNRTVVPVGSGVAGCTTANGATTCTVEFAAPVGTTSVNVSTYASTDGTGTPLSVAAVSVTVVAGQVNSVTVTLSGVVASLRLAGPSVTFNVGSASSAAIVVQALDAAGQVIVGPGSYVDANGNPLTITLSDSDTSGATSLSPTAITGPSTAVVLSYNGAAIGNVTITASAPGVTPATQTITVNQSPQPGYVLVDGLHGGTSIAIYTILGGSSGVGLGSLQGYLASGYLTSFISSGHTGSLYGSGGTINVFHYPPNPAPSSTYDRTFQAKNGTGGFVADDSADGVWQGEGASIDHYPAGATGSATPDRQVTGIAGLPPSYTWDSYVVAVDSKNRLYTIAGQVGTTNYRVYELPANASGVTTPIASYPYDRPTASVIQDTAKVTVDQHDDSVWIFPSNIYAGGSATPGSAGAAAVAINGLVAFKQGASTPYRTISLASNKQILSVAFDSRQNVLAVTDENVVDGFDSTQSGIVTTPVSSTAIPGSMAITIPVTATAANLPPTTPQTANGAITASPGSFSFLGSGPAYAATLTVSESGYGGAFTATSGNTAIATVAAGSTPNTFTVTPVNAGTTTIRVADANYGYADVPVTVSISGLQLQGRR